MSGGSFFSPLDDSSKADLLPIFRKEASEVFVWKKGQNDRLEISLLELSGNLFNIEFSAKTELDNGEFLFSCKHRGVFYFTKVELSKQGKGYSISFNTQLFKSERRKNFRLKTVPYHNVQLHIGINYFQDYDKENLKEDVGDSTETNLFKNFLQECVLDDAGDFLVCEVRDISITGLSFWLIPEYSKHFSKNKIIKDTKLIFNSEEFIIPKLEWVYSIEVPEDKKKRAKIALTYLEIDDVLKDLLQNKINKEMRDRDATIDFEEFVAGES